VPGGVTDSDSGGAVRGHGESAARPSPPEPLTLLGHGTVAGPSGGQQVTLRTPAELADALPYLLGYRPEDSIVLVALHDREWRGRFGGRARLGIPGQTDDWPSVAQQLARGLVTGSERRGARPESMVAYLCQEPRSGETGRDVMERLRPLAHLLRTACGSLDVPVVEALCISGGRFWSYCCPSEDCCSPQGESMGLPGTSVLAAAATYAGLQVRGSLREFRARLAPWETAAALEQEAALDAASMDLVPRILEAESRAEVAEEALGLARRLMGRLAEVPPVSGTLQSDLRDDELLGHDEAATLVLALQDRTTRDRAAEWMEGDDAGPALRLWRTLARRCVGPYGEHAAAPLTLAGWVAWSSGDELEAREALAMALGADPSYLFARLLHQACNEGLDPESIRRCLRAERIGRAEEHVDLPDAACRPAERGDLSGVARRPAEHVDLSNAARPSTEHVDPSDAARRPAARDTCKPTSSGRSAAAPQTSGAGSRRRRRVRGAAAGTHPSRRTPGSATAPAPGTPVARRHRPVDGTSPAGEGPGRADEGSKGRSPVRRRSARPGTGEGT
ncbi:MAG: hypothetical protein QOC85_286, partial [Streptomyces sp.]|nr:hypothetical protein [Streptomyces sp.]